MERNTRETLPLVTWRARNGWTLDDLAERAGVSKQYLWSVENERWRRQRRPRLAKQVADALGLVVDQVTEYKRIFGLPGLT